VVARRPVVGLDRAARAGSRVARPAGLARAEGVVRAATAIGVRRRRVARVGRAETAVVTARIVPARDREDVAARYGAGRAAVDETGRRVVVQEASRDARAHELLARARDARPRGEAGAYRPAAETADAAVGVAGLPLDRVVVELDVERTRGNVVAPDENDLERVQL